MKHIIMKHIIKPNELEAIALAASKKEDRYYLCGVYIQPDGGMIATDGNRIHTLRAGKTYDKEGIIFRNADIKKALSMAKAQIKENRSTAEFVRIVIDERHVNLAYYNEDDEDQTGASLGGFAYKPVDGNYPDWSRIMPADDWQPVLSPASFNAAFMVDFGKVSKLLTASKLQAVRVYNYGMSKPLDIRVYNDDFAGALMQVRF